MSENNDFGAGIVSKSRVLIDGDMSDKKLLQLINLGAEEEKLDYKTTYSLTGKTKTKDKVELVRDVIAMANTHGGYIVLGIKENTDGKKERYEPIGLTDKECASLDISKLMEQVESFISAKSNIQFQIYQLPEFDNKKFAFLFVPPSQESPIIFIKDGQYKDPRSGKNLFAFKEGDIVIRKGGSTERVGQGEMRKIISDIRTREKDRWTEEILGFKELIKRLDALITLLSGTSVSTKIENLGSLEINSISHVEMYDESNFYLAPKVFMGKILDVLELDKKITVNRYIRESVSLFYSNVMPLSELQAEGKLEEAEVFEKIDNYLSPILDNLISIAIISIDYGYSDMLLELREALYAICKKADQGDFLNYETESIYINKIWLWQEVMIRVYALGAFLVKKKKWQLTRILIEQEIDWDSDYFRSQYWSRYFLTMASRANQLQDKGWAPSTVKYINEHAWVRDYFLGDEDAIISGVCQFDFLQCIYLESNNLNKPQNAYPSFGIYYRQRTEPIISTMLKPGLLRDTIADISNQDLAIMIHSLNRTANEQFRWSGWNAYGWSDEEIPKFLEDNLPKTEH